MFSESPEIEAKQIQYLKENDKLAILEARKAFAERMADPEYGYKIFKKFAIGRDKVAEAFDNVIKSIKSGTEKSVINSLEETKNDFLESHPKWADAQYWNEVKRSIYDMVDEGYSKDNTSAKIKALKGVANIIKKSVEEIIPKIKGLNQEQGALLNIRDAIIQSSPKEVRDTALLSPIKENLAFKGGRMLAKEIPTWTSPAKSFAEQFLNKRNKK
jgi:hypothetical protein